MPLISSAGLSPCRDKVKDHSKDNVLIEYEYALKVRDIATYRKGVVNFCH